MLLEPGDGIPGRPFVDQIVRYVPCTGRLLMAADAKGLGLDQCWPFALARALALDPEIVFLDEPTGGVDPVTRRQFWDLIYDVTSKGMTVFVTTHYMDEAEYCNRLSIMVDGKIRALGSPSALRQEFSAASMDDVFYKLARGAERT